MIYIDTDIAMGGSQGDVDDGFAIAALLLSGMEVEAIGTVFGNCDEAQVFRNVEGLLSGFHNQPKRLHGATKPREKSNPASQFLQTFSGTVVALGPLTNLAAALENGPCPWERIIAVGSHSSSVGRWPPYFPFEYNFTLDPQATERVVNADVPLTLIPLNACGRLRVTMNMVSKLPGEVGEYLHLHSRRWFKRALWLKARKTVPVWDLVAAMMLINPDGYELKTGKVKAHPNGWVQYGQGRTIQWLYEFSPSESWERFETFFALSG